MTRKAIRCAIYTRKSSEEGLDQAFNSLDAQREACLSYIASQTGEGWRPITARYDDGGLSGGTLDRPAMETLLADIHAGKIDMVVVYKIDRLTRSLADFSRLVERFDKANCSFVSVTQAFNTATSMGRLTLNVLLSFAQFEREVTSERIRDKIAASKKKGMWMGGVVPLGFDLERSEGGRRLVPNREEAGHVRRLFELYEEAGDLRHARDRATREGIRSKRRRRKDGSSTGGCIIARGALHAILTNPIYIGKIRHRQTVHEGLHAAIIDEELWSRVQTRLQAQAGRRRVRDGNTGRLVQPVNGAPLTGKMVDETGDGLTPTHTSRKTANGPYRRRYYVSRRLVTPTLDRQQRDPTGWRLPAADLEYRIASAIGRHIDTVGIALLPGLDVAAASRAFGQVRSAICVLTDQPEGLRDLVETVVVKPGSLSITLARSGLAWIAEVPSDKIASEVLAFDTPFHVRRRGVEMKLMTGPAEPEPDRTLIRAIANAHQWLSEVRSGTSMAAIGRRHGWTDAPVRQRIRLAFLSPAITEAILKGRQPAALTLQRLLKQTVPIDWDAQWHQLGFAETGK